MRSAKKTEAVLAVKREREAHIGHILLTDLCLTDI